MHPWLVHADRVASNFGQVPQSIIKFTLRVEVFQKFGKMRVGGVWAFSQTHESNAAISTYPLQLEVAGGIVLHWR